MFPLGHTAAKKHPKKCCAGTKLLNVSVGFPYTGDTTAAATLRVHRFSGNKFSIARGGVMGVKTA